MTLFLRLENLIAPALAALGFELVTCQFVSEAGRKTFRIYIDSPAPLTVDDCIHASRRIHAILEVEPTIEMSYDVEVSSPGLDRPLITLAHFQRFLQKEAKITLRTPLEGRRHFTGILLSATEQNIQILVDDKTVVLDFENIEKATLVPDVRF